MDKLYNSNKSKFIAYNHYKSNKKNSPHVVFLHGFMSNMYGTKSSYIENHCINNDYNYITFDHFGHGQSSGELLDETLESWLSGLETVLERLIEANEPVILVGSSLGGWLATLAAVKWPHKIKALICLAAAVDFTEELIWKKLPAALQRQLEAQNLIEVGGSNLEYKFKISYRLITNARKYLLLHSDSIKINCPVHLIHGILDEEVPYTVSQELFKKITGNNIVLKLIKDGNHNLKRPSDLKIITNSLDELIQILG